MKRNKERVSLARKYQKENRENPQISELRFMPFIKDYKYIFQKIIFVDDYMFYIVDFYLPKYNIAIEIDGRQHKDSVEYDTLRTYRLKQAGVRKVLRFSNEDIRTMDRDMIKNIIKVNLLA